MNSIIPYNIQPTSIIFYIIIFVAFLYFLTIAPRQKVKRKSISLHNEISKNREILFECPSALDNRQGYLVLTKSSLEFYYFKTERKNNFYVLLKDITSVSVSGDFLFGKKLIVNTLGDEIFFTCNEANECKKQIEQLCSIGS